MPLSFYPREAALEEGRGLAKRPTECGELPYCQQSSAEAGRQQVRKEQKVGDRAWDLEG